MIMKVVRLIWFVVLVAASVDGQYVDDDSERFDDDTVTNDDDNAPTKDDDDFTPSNDDDWVPPDISCIIAQFYPDDHNLTTACLKSEDKKGNHCQYCDSAGCGHVCLTSEQAEIVTAKYGYSCFSISNNDQEDDVNNNDKMEEYTYQRTTIVDSDAAATATTTTTTCDDSCARSFSIDPTPEGCEKTKDHLGNFCQFCQGSIWGSVCLSSAQIYVLSQLMFYCPSRLGPPLIHKRPAYDPTCMASYLNSLSIAHCVNETKSLSDGSDCYFCGYGPGGLYMCLDEDQAREGMDSGLGCLGPGGGELLPLLKEEEEEEEEEAEDGFQDTE